MQRLEDHKKEFAFKEELYDYAKRFDEDIPNLVNLLLLGSSFVEKGSVEKISLNENNFVIEDSMIENVDDSNNTRESTACEINNDRYVGKFVSSNVVNISKRVLSQAEISLLSKGLKFIPTPPTVNRAILKEELEVFGRKLRLKWHFRDNESSGIYNIFKKKSNFKPRKKDAAIEIYLSKLEEEIFNLDFNLQYNNLTKAERAALRNLRDDTSIVIKEADKGSAVVVWDREDYLAEADKQLGDSNVYAELKGDFVSPLIKTIKHHLSKVKLIGDVSQETLEFFVNDNPRIGRFYMLPKIHKRLYAVPGRPVISNCGYYTENISAFLDYHLQPLARSVKSYIKDTNDFLRKLSVLNDLPDDFILCTVDVVGLYPNIPHNDGLAALKRVLEEREDPKISTESLLELTECVLKNNVFEHDERFFRQKQGTAIGTKMAPPYAILFMSDLEQKFLDSSPLKPLVWWRYIDDIFLIWQHGEESLTKFLENLNDCHPTIKFTAEHSREKINFLDVEVSVKGNKLVTDLYIKPTDTHQYLHATSCHPSHCKTSIPYSQALRLNRICSEGSFFDKRCNELESWLMQRGFSAKKVRQQVLKARGVPRNEALNNTRPKRPAPDLVLNITYHPAYRKLRSVLENIHLLLTPDEEHRKVFGNIPTVGFKRGRSLKDLLVRAKLPTNEDGNKGCEGCGREDCGVCPFIKSTKEFTDKNRSRTYEIRNTETLNCDSSCVVYLMSCKSCHMQYVGSCTTPFRQRFANYKSCFKRSAKQVVPQASLHRHFRQSNHKGTNDWEFVLIDEAPDLDTVRKKESFWQYKLNVFQPDGLCEKTVSTSWN